MLPVVPAVEVVAGAPNDPKLNPVDGAEDAGGAPKLPNPADGVVVVPNPKTE